VSFRKRVASAADETLLTDCPMFFVTALSEVNAAAGCVGCCRREDTIFASVQRRGLVLG